MLLLGGLVLFREARGSGGLGVSGFRDVGCRRWGVDFNRMRGCGPSAFVVVSQRDAAPEGSAEISKKESSLEV